MNKGIMSLFEKRKSLKRGDVIKRVAGSGLLGEKAVFLEYYKPSLFQRMLIRIRYVGYVYYDSDYDTDLAANFVLYKEHNNENVTDSK